MIKVEEIEVWGFKHAIKGMRNPHRSWGKSDSKFVWDGFPQHNVMPDDLSIRFKIGPNDLSLMQKLYKAGAEHRKYLRQIFVSMDAVSNHVWWSEFDTYKVGTTRNSCSKMHKIHVKSFEEDDFSHEGIYEVGGKTRVTFDLVLHELEQLRKLFNETHEKKYWRAMIELLPMSYNLRATITMNYENVVNIIHQRENHKLDEWNVFCDTMLEKLPYLKEIMEYGKTN